MAIDTMKARSGREDGKSLAGAGVIEKVGSWQQYFVPTSSERVQKAKRRAIRPMEI